MSSRWPAERFDRASYPGPEIELPVFYGDLDTNRHLNNVAFGRFFEHARYTIHRGLGLAERLHEHGGIMLVARVAIDYLAEGHSGQPIRVCTRMARVGRSSIFEEQAAFQNDVCIAFCEVVVAYRKDGASAPWPSDILTLWETLMLPSARP